MKVLATINRAIVKAGRRVGETWGGSVFALVVSSPPILLLLIGLWFNLQLFANMAEDTTGITITAFGITATLAALSFSCARSIDEPEVRDRYSFAGERLFHAALLLLAASLLKMMAVRLGVGSLVPWPETFYAVSIQASLVVTRFLADLLVASLFFWALLSAHGGFVVLNRLLWSRINRFPEWDNFA